MFVYTFGSAGELLILVKIPRTRKMLNNLLGEKFIIQHLGEYTATKTFLKAALPAILVTAGEMVTRAQEWQRLDHIADSYEKGALDAYRACGKEITFEELKELKEKCHNMRSQEVKGLFGMFNSPKSTGVD